LIEQEKRPLNKGTIKSSNIRPLFFFIKKVWHIPSKLQILSKE
jgi:hypothetical protein